MATAKQAKNKRISKKHFWEHTYLVTKVDPGLHRCEEITVIGSRAATAKQIEIEDAGFFAIVLNTNTKEEEYRTPGCEK